VRRSAKRGTIEHAFAAVPARAIADRLLSDRDRHVLEAIALHGGSGRGCTAGNARLAALTGRSERSVTRAVTQLINRHYVCDTGGADGRQRSRYRCLKVVRTPTDDAVARGADADAAAQARPGGVKIRRGTVQWVAWQEAYRQRGDWQADRMEAEEQHEWTVPSTWPDHLAT
jgi:hypothetical protein